MQLFAFKKQIYQDDTLETSSSIKRRRRTLPSVADYGVGGLAAELLGDAPLRLIIVGHNPSETAWNQGHYYANPTNWMWRILRDIELAPAQDIRGPEDDKKMPTLVGVGFTDVGAGHPGTNSSKFTSANFSEWRQPFFDRLSQHAQRAAETLGCVCGSCGFPSVVAFSGKRQFSELFKKKPSKCIALGRQSIVPTDWPFPLDKTEVWVMPSTSGAAAMGREERYGPWKDLAVCVLQEPWPRAVQDCCRRASLSI